VCAADQSKFPLAKGRFSEEEKKSFGRWSFLSANPRCFVGAAEGGGMSRVVSVPALQVSRLEEPFAAEHRREELNTQVKGMLERLLPAARDSPDSPQATGAPDFAAQGSPCRRPGGPPEQQLSSPLVRTPTRGTRTKSKSPSPSTQRAEQARATAPPQPQRSEQDESPDGGVGGNGEALSAGGGKFQKDVLERFRQELLQRFLSLHDAFSRMNHEVSRDKALTRKEFNAALAHLGAGQEESDDIFDAMDSKGDGGVTLSEFLHALVDVSPEALLWELRCRLLRFNIGSHNLQKALELVRWPQHGWLSRATKVKRRGMRRRCTCCSSTEGCDCKTVEGARAEEAALEAALPGIVGQPGLGLRGARPNSAKRPNTAPGNLGSFEDGGDEETRKKPSPYHLTRGDWLKFCTSLYLTLLEAERLFLRLADNKRFVDLRAMFETLRTTVEPDITLERFVVKACSRYENLPGAFAACCEDRSYLPSCPEPLMWWSGFQGLAVALNVNDESAARLWGVLVGAVEAKKEDIEVDEYAQVGVSVTEEAFVRELAMWAPDTALEDIKENLCNRFGSLAEGQRALGRRLSDTAQLSPQEFQTRLRAAGIKNCDVNKALSTVAAKGGPVSLEAAIDTMRAVKTNAGKTAGELGKSAQASMRNQTQPMWDQLRTMQKDCQRRYDEGAEGEWRSPAAWRSPSTPSRQDAATPTKHGAEDQQKFTDSINGAVRTANSSRSKSVLHQAHRQVLNLEKRWSGSPPEGLECATPPRLKNTHGSSRSVPQLVRLSPCTL